MIKDCLYVKNSKNRGRGVFTKKDIPANTIIEISPVVVLPVKEAKHILKTKMQNYVFCWGNSARKIGVALGWGAIYNHSYASNAEYSANFKKNTLTIRTVRPIKKGTEIFVNYNCDHDSKKPVWFDVK